MTSEGGFKEKPLSAKREGLLQLCLCQRSFLFPFHIYNATFRMCRGFLLVYGDVFLYGSGEDYKVLDIFGEFTIISEGEILSNHNFKSPQIFKWLST